MKPHQERVVIEKQELDEKIGKLQQFQNTPFFQTLNGLEIDRLNRQLVVMEQYSEILGERIAQFE